MELTKKIDFVAFVSVTNANPNGDPLNENMPRADFDGYGEISDVCIKRKIRNRMQDILETPNSVFVQTDERCDDGFKCLKARADKTIGLSSKSMTPDEFVKKACEQWIDVRTFGQVFAFDKKTLSVGVRGPVSIHMATSVNPVEINSMQITKSVSGTKEEEKGSDTMGMKHTVRYGLYKIKGSISVQLAEKTGFSEDDASMVKECLRTLFVNDASAARPDGSMEVVSLYWFEHNNKIGQYPSIKVHNSVNAKLKEGIRSPRSIDDYEFEIKKLPGLDPEIIEGV